MAIPSDTIWEVQSTGSDNNGGGFSDANKGATGTDMTTSAAIVSTGTLSTAGLGATLLTATGSPWTNAVLGNVIQITAGTNFQTGFYCVTGFTDANNITLDRTPTSAAAGSAGTGSLGGPVVTLSKPAVVAGNTVYVKATATYTLTAGITLSTSGTAVLPISYIGYTTSRTDGGSVTYQRTSGAINLINSSGTSVRFRNFIMDVNSGTGSTGIIASGSNNCLENIVAKNFSNVGIQASGNVIFLKGCTATGGISGSAKGIYVTGTFAMLVDCESTANQCPGISSNSNGITLVNCISSNNTGSTSDGFYFNGSQQNCTVLNCSFYGNGRNGILYDTTTQAAASNAAFVLNSIFVSNGAYGINSNTTVQLANSVMLNSNAFYNNTSGARNNMPAGSADVTLTADPFVSSSGNNFALNNLAGGGIPCRAAGFPATYGSGLTASFTDLGAAQHKSTMLLPVGMTGGCGA